MRHIVQRRAFRRQQPRYRSILEFLSVSSQFVLPSSPPVRRFYRGDNYSDAGGFAGGWWAGSVHEQAGWQAEKLAMSATRDTQINEARKAEAAMREQVRKARGAQIYQRRLEMEQQIADMSREQLEAFVPGWPVSLQEAVA